MSLRTFANPAAVARLALGTDGPPDRTPMRFHERLPGYARTPLVEAPRTAERLGVARVLVKDESRRLGLPAFKVLGASWAVYDAVRRLTGVELGDWTTLDDLKDRLRPLGTRTLVTATDGNHGRAVAHLARLFDWPAQILVPAGTAEARIADIAAEGATVEVVDGSYDDAVELAAGRADDATLVVSDTSWPGYESIPRAVIDGYSTLFHEIADATDVRPTTVAVQIGVGALAAAAVRHVHATPGDPRATLVGVEPATADCVAVSARRGELADTPGPHPSIMAGLNAGKPSLVAWPLLLAGIDTFVAIDDDPVPDAMRLLAADGVVAGETGAAGLAGLLAVHDAGTPADRAAAGLTPDATVLVLVTEGATDPAGYERAVGGPAAGR